jgi:hypothetical protein
MVHEQNERVGLRAPGRGCLDLQNGKRQHWQTFFKAVHNLVLASQAKPSLCLTLGY